MENQDNIWYKVGIVVGIICVLLGCYFVFELSTQTQGFYGRLYDVSFGGDYYTESHKAMTYTGNAVAALYRITCYGIGALLCAVGSITSVCCAAKIEPILKKELKEMFPNEKEKKEEVNENGR